MQSVSIDQYAWTNEMVNRNAVMPVPSDLSERILTLNLALGEDRTITLRSCEVLGRGFRNRVSFQERSDIDAILVARLAHSVRKCLLSLTDGKQVLAMPEFLVELPGLVLSGVHVLVMELKDGVRNAIFRVKEFMGSLNNAFHQDIGFQEPYSDHAERLATNVLADICMPLLNMCREMEFSQIDTRDHLPTGFAERAREFEFQTELLKRFIYNAGTGHAQATQVYLEPEYQSQPLKIAPS
ncbi:hypothetical protein ROLI_019640 [Roseobacter fucihabitans]|uniref:Uncharacterized protein n=1 Tax=Roseobacter fucihabitans TaxID=1537242 RepID=A0ABZ2BU95_9RHOB|nr:hypothetical protein [Roseobacter litoralis]MBC6966178.1 hypothetical protein [Roseobacter litoralis]